MDWIITLPKTVEWSDYEKELQALEDPNVVLNFRIPVAVKAVPGDRCFLCWRGQVRGYMTVSQVFTYAHGFKCATTGKIWPAGHYIQRHGPWVPINDYKLVIKSFQGIRKFKDGERL